MIKMIFTTAASENILSTVAMDVGLFPRIQPCKIGVNLNLNPVPPKPNTTMSAGSELLQTVELEPIDL